MKKNVFKVCLLLVAVLVVVSCENKGNKSQSSVVEKDGGAPHGTFAKKLVSLNGKVMEVKDSNEFTFIRFQSDKGEKWAAVPATEIKVGEDVLITEGEVLQNFPSKSLGRTFPELIVASGIVGKDPKAPGFQNDSAPHAKSEAAHESKDRGNDTFAAALQKERSQTMQAMPSGVTDKQAEIDPSLMGSTKAIVPFVDLKVKKATGKNSYRVGELFEKGAALDGKKVKVRGQIVKVSLNIMGKNWLHIQDGTGNTLKNTHDLVVTTAATPEKGSVVIVEGALHANRDFGFGYKYPIIVEDALISE